MKLELIGDYIICKIQICKTGSEETAEDLGVEVDYSLEDAVIPLQGIHHCFEYEKEFIKIVYENDMSLIIESTFKEFTQVYRKYLFEKNFLTKIKN